MPKTGILVALGGLILSAGATIVAYLNPSLLTVLSGKGAPKDVQVFGLANTGLFAAVLAYLIWKSRRR